MVNTQRTTLTHKAFISGIFCRTDRTNDERIAKYDENGLTTIAAIAETKVFGSSTSAKVMGTSTETGIDYGTSTCGR